MAAFITTSHLAGEKFDERHRTFTRLRRMTVRSDTDNEAIALARELCWVNYGERCASYVCRELANGVFEIELVTAQIEADERAKQIAKEAAWVGEATRGEFQRAPMILIEPPPRIPPAIEEGPVTFREFLEKARAEQFWGGKNPYYFLPENRSNAVLAKLTGYDGIGLWLYPDRKSPMEYTLKPKIHWQRCIFIATMIAASMLVVLCRLWTSLPGTSLWH